MTLSPLPRQIRERTMSRRMCLTMSHRFSASCLLTMRTISQVAGALFSSGCLKFGTFRLKSGVLSPYYIDLASVLTSPEDLCRLADVAAERVKQIATTSKIDKLATIELKVALILPSIACRTNLPSVIVRKEAKRN